MNIITTTNDLTALCADLAATDYVTVDTEFMRERTFWPHLCLIQVAGPDEAVAIDPEAEGIDLEPFFALMADENVMKVFHAARQDVEIIYYLSKRMPKPLFDTQVAAMVCGYGDSVSYEALASKLARAKIDKSLRFTDWSHRPLTDRQVAYALDDVRHLRVIYDRLTDQLAKSGRAPWVAEEMAALTNPAIYDTHPEESWRRIKTRTREPRFLALLREVAAWREREAQTRDVPRNRILRDEALIEIAAHGPDKVETLARTRGLGKGMAHGAMGRDILAAVARGKKLPEKDCPRVDKPRPPQRGIGPVVDLLKVLLKMKCEEHDVAQRLIANTADLERIAGERQPGVPALHGWRREVFGDDALALKEGKVALVVRGRRLRLVPADGQAKAAD